MRAPLIAASAAVLALAAGVARADHRGDDGTSDSEGARGDGAADRQVAIVNAAAKLGDIGQIKRVRRVLSRSGMLFKMSDELEATLEGRNVLISDLDAIKDAYANSNFDAAIKLIDADRDHILRDAASRDPIPALTELAQWRGVIAVAQDDSDEALEQFRAAYRFNPAWSIDKRIASPRVRSIAKRAHEEVEDRGVLRIEADPDEATVSIDGGDARAVDKKLELPVGLHLVTITAPHRKPYAELVKIGNKPYRLTISLDHEDKIDRASKLVDETVAAPPGKPRLKTTRALAKLTGAAWLLVIEDGSEDKITMRLYDPKSHKVSKALEVDDDATSAVIERKVMAALDPDNLVDVDSVSIHAGNSEPTPWYGHWYVWAGVAAVLGGGIAGYEYMHREPTSIRGF